MGGAAKTHQSNPSNTSKEGNEITNNITGNGSFGGLGTGPIADNSGFQSNQSRPGGFGANNRENSGEKSKFSSGNDTSNFENKIKPVSLNDTGPLSS